MENNLTKIEVAKGKAARDAEFSAYGASQFEQRVLSPQEVADLVTFQLEANNTREKYSRLVDGKATLVKV